MTVCPICSNTGVLRGPGPHGTVVPCICRRKPVGAVAGAPTSDVDDDEDWGDDWGECHPCSVCGEPCLYGSRHVQCAPMTAEFRADQLRRGRVRGVLRAAWVLVCLAAAGVAGSSWGFPW